MCCGTVHHLSCKWDRSSPPQSLFSLPIQPSLFQQSSAGPRTFDRDKVSKIPIIQPNLPNNIFLNQHPHRSNQSSWISRIYHAKLHHHNPLPSHREPNRKDELTVPSHRSDHHGRVAHTSNHHPSEASVFVVLMPSSPVSVLCWGSVAIEFVVEWAGGAGEPASECTRGWTGTCLISVAIWKSCDANAWKEIW